MSISVDPTTGTNQKAFAFACVCAQYSDVKLLVQIR
jgi:hypothetical protein